MPQETTFTPLFGRHSSLLPAVAVDAAGPCEFEIVAGREAILNLQPRLADLATRTGQTGEVDSLAYFLSTPTATRKTPHLLLTGDPVYGTAHPTSAVLLFEYRTRIGGTRVFSTADGSGRRDILAPRGKRARTAALAARTLLDRGAHIVHLAFCEEHDDSDQHPGEVKSGHTTSRGAAEQTIAAELRARVSRRMQAEWALRENNIPAYLPLLPTFDETLARIGAKTRSNLRYYRRRCEQELGATFIPDVEISLSDFLAFNRVCTYAVSDELATYRYRTLQASENQYLRGVQDCTGRWLSMIGIRRQSNFVEVDWQMNRAELRSLSLATVMRSCLIQHEISLGATRLYMEGGTPQSIANSFLQHRIGELTVVRNSAYVRLLKRFAPFVFPSKNYIGQTLASPDLHWKPW